LISKIKVTVSIVFFLILATLFGLYSLERSKNFSLRKEQARLLEKLRLAELKKEISETPVKEIKSLHRKDAKSAKDEKNGSGVCEACFQDYQYRVEVRDEDGRWIFSDDNIFDERPGSLTLTDKFWEQVMPAEKTPNALNLRGTSVPTLPRLKNRVLIGFELDQYKIEYAYSPLGLQTSKLNLNLAIYSSLSMSYTSSPLEARAGVGLEIRF
jgi:hypothetical protein